MGECGGRRRLRYTYVFAHTGKSVKPPSQGLGEHTLIINSWFSLSLPALYRVYIWRAKPWRSKWWPIVCRSVCVFIPALFQMTCGCPCGGMLAWWWGCLRIFCRAMHCRLLLLLLAAKTILSGSAVTQTRDGSNAASKGSSDNSMRSPNTVSRNKKSRSDNNSDLAGNTTANPVLLSSPSTASSGIQQGKRSSPTVLTLSPWWIHPFHHKIFAFSKCIVKGMIFSLNE